MRIKLRPDTHFAPVADGVHFARGGRMFVLAGPPALFTLLDENVDRLAVGTDLDELVHAVGTEQARPVLRTVLAALVQQDVLLRLDTLRVPPPEPAEAQRYRDVLAYLEAEADEPYDRFARLRRSRVLVIGDGPAAAVARRSLASSGIDAISATSPSDVVGSAPPGSAWSGSVPPWDAVVEVRTAGTAATAYDAALAVRVDERDGVTVITLEGPHVSGTDNSSTTLAARAERWSEVEPELWADGPVLGALTGALAAGAVLDRVTGIGDPGFAATIVYGRMLATARVDVPVVASADERGIDPDGLSGLTSAQLLDRLEPLSRRWVGRVHRRRDLDLVQLPMAVATVDVIAAAGGPVTVAAGWGDDRAGALVSATLAGLRGSGHADLAPARWPAAAAAGLSEARGLADGALRLLGAQWLAMPGSADSSTAVHVRPIGWADLTSPALRARWSVLADYLDLPGSVRVSTDDTLNWHLATFTSTSGELRRSEWAPTLTDAVSSVLAAAAAWAQADAEIRALLADPIGASVLHAPARSDLPAAIVRLEKYLADLGRTASGHADPPDPVLGPLPVWTGVVRLG